MKLGSILFCVGAFSVLTSCSVSPRPTTETLYLNHYMVECAGPYLQLCHLDKEDAADTWTYRYSDVIGLEYEWGYTYTLRVREEEIQDPLPDMSSVATTLLEVLNKERVAPDVRFQIELTTSESSDEFAEQFMVQKAANLFEFHETKEFTCSETVCAELGGLLDQNLKVTLEFTHPKNSGEPLIAQQILSTEVLPEQN